MTRITPYEEVNHLLQSLILKLHATLNNNLTGVYLYGSLTWGDFNEQISDIDILVVTEKFIHEKDFQHLNEMHQALTKQYKNWHDRIEIAYIAKETLKTFKDRKSNIAVISPGEAFNIKKAGTDWLINYYLIQENSITLFGPEPTSIITPISRSEFISNVKEQALEWRHWVEHTKGSTGFQFYAVLTISRAMYAIQHGVQGSKIVAGNWAKNKYPKWAHLIDESLAWRTHPDARKHNDKLYDEVEKFIFEMLDSLH